MADADADASLRLSDVIDVLRCSDVADAYQVVV